MKTRTQEALTGWLFSAPALIGVAIFMIVPFCMSVVYSFTNKMLVQKPGEPLQFTFLDNYIKLFTNDLAHQAFMNTLLYAVMVVPTTILLGTLLAVFVNSKLRGVKIFRTIYFSPQVVTMTVVAVVWSFIFSSSESGLMNSALQLFGLEPQRWLQDTHWAMFCIAVMYIWQSLGLQMLIVLGGLQYIPEELYEAAYLDGCNTFQKFWRITVPMLKNTLVYVLISTTINTLKPVSYTHLDVYKRQPPRCACSSEKPVPPAKAIWQKKSCAACCLWRWRACPPSWAAGPRPSCTLRPLWAAA